MPDQNLPIKIFYKRGQYDQRATEGMGNKQLPKWVEGPAELAAKSELFQQALAETATGFANRPADKAFIPAVMKVALRSQALAKTPRAAVGELFNRNKSEYNFIGSVQPSELLVRVDSAQHLEFITRNVAQPQEFQVGMSAINELAPFEPIIELPQDLTGTVLKVKLIHFQERHLDEQIEASFEATLRQQQVTFSKIKYTVELTIYELQPTSVDALQVVQDFEALLSITPAPVYGVGLDEADAAAAISVKVPVTGQEYPTIGILDSGIEPIDHLREWLDPRSYVAVAPEDLDRAHGTGVASIVLYGDELQGKQWVGHGAYKLLDATVFPRRGKALTEGELIKRIQEAVSRFPDVKIWNLSGGGDISCPEQDFSDFGKALDAIQDRYQVLISKSAGNCRNFEQFMPKARIARAADSVRSLVVASMAHDRGPDDDVDADWPSPFSRSGFGPNNLAKPDIAHYGGNSGAPRNGQKASYTGVNAFSLAGGIIQLSGTSFSTPRITALLGGLNQRMADGFDPLLLKTLVVHSASYPAGLALDPIVRLKELGYGRPGSVEQILYTNQHEITIILRDKLIKGGYLEMWDFPFPEELIDNGHYYGEVILTMVGATRLDGTQGVEYCQSDLKVALGTYDRIIPSTSKRKRPLNPYQKENAGLTHQI
ncbi:S8 family peptidase [Hymenobacter metallilatus]|uniref:S8 family peptidase n=1 Tax=Hymenobacter metallilatus TaxID=2493666 RepID=A0A428IXV2_9BACT|nr:S8 family peptidase [Hymenobacter metallilatus]RSK23852.1 S8 family peptidase [Hymenobacter metallilatus]